MPMKISRLCKRISTCLSTTIQVSIANSEIIQNEGNRDKPYFISKAEKRCEFGVKKDLSLRPRKSNFVEGLEI